ncbi:unnamed protein product [Clonostachys rhizophaga]|uniref:Tyrosine specific protein phosphatases domain-containing protein n=2 Tax=Clonostachys TaxID=110564 RepID=A0A9N9VS71_9HYPO|nr:unnamed protein product [Clonostachys rhizophaga]CAI6091683.1 unnamed protein product [Clonostachys chloroleuca]
MYAPKAYGLVLKHLATENKLTPLLVHCRGGEGRTGLLIAIILALCGVPRDLIALEYSLTHADLSSIGTESAECVLGPLGWDVDLEAKAKSLSFIHESIDIVFEILDTTYGGITGYVKNYCGLSDEEIEMIRKNLTMN